jgi:hypothetical protein
MPVYHSPGYYGLAWAIIIVVCAVGLVIVGAVLADLLIRLFS